MTSLRSNGLVAAQIQIHKQKSVQENKLGINFLLICLHLTHELI